jgi:hypothetical protein
MYQIARRRAFLFVNSSELRMVHFFSQIQALYEAKKSGRNCVRMNEPVVRPFVPTIARSAWLPATAQR